LEKVLEFINWLEKWRVGMGAMLADDKVVENLGRLHAELVEASREGKGEIDLDLLFLDVLIACGLMNADRLKAVIGNEAALRALMMVVLPENVTLGGVDE
jgi:hypothetical protein